MLHRLALGLISLMMSSAAYALGLGDIHVRSGLNQPLEAEIELIAVRPEEQDNISVSLASTEAFAQAGVERPFLLTSLYFRVLQKPDGKPYIRVFSQEPIKEPFLNYLIEVNWPNGRLLKQYTLLLDPPTFVRAAPPAIKAPAAGPVPAGTPPETAPAAETQISPAPQTAGVTGADAGAEYVVQRADTLSTLANRLRPDNSVTIEQMMLALFEANPEAFLHQNINGLKAGYTLRIPDLNEIAGLSQTDALREVKQQYARWNNIKSARADAAGTAASDATGADHRLKLVAAGAAQGDARTDGAPGAGSADLKQDLAVTAEALESSKLENEELRSRIADLEQQVETMQRMITLKDENLAALQSKLGAAAAPEGEETTPGQAAAQTAAEEPVTAESTGAEGQAIEESAPEQAPAESGATGEDAAGAPAARTPALSGLIDSLPRDPKTLGMAGGALLLALALIQVIRRREANSIITAGSGTLTHSAAAPLAESATRETAQTALPDEKAAASPDPVAEADVHIAYEQYPQAENILKRAVAAQPERHDLKLKLLELYHLTHNSSAFLTQAEELYTALGGTGADIWDKVATMGKELAPGDPLFGGGEAFGTESVSAPEIDVTLPAAPETATLEITPAEQAEARADNTLDFTLDFDTGTQSADALDAQGVAEYNLADLQLDADAKPDQPGETEIDLAKLDLGAEPPRDNADLSPDFDLGGADDALRPDTSAETDTALEFDTDVTTTDEVATKLDLARAYIDMGDAEGARSILDEVTQEGNAAQKKEAQELMRQIA
jgi:pilus assembly protein FimV